MSMYFLYRRGSHEMVLDVSDPEGRKIIEISEKIKDNKFKIHPEKIKLVEEIFKNKGRGEDFINYLSLRKDPVIIWQKD